MSLPENMNVSDEEFLKMEAPVSEPSTPSAAQEPASKTTDVVVEPVTTQPTAEEIAEQARIDTEGQQQAANVKSEPTQEELAAQAEANNGKTPEQIEAERVAVEAAATTEAEPDYKVLYEGMIKPLKANGKEITLKSHDELIQLAQQGANYTRKMQQLAPHRKALMMLENNKLLDPEQLSFLIDLQRRDPAAIQKLLKESEVNPLDIDVEAESTYQGGKHLVTDEEANFRAALDEARESEVGRTVLTAIDGTWDQASKELVFKQPAILATMVQQHESGVYTLIADEMHRQSVLGKLPAGRSWLENYKAVGDQLVAAGAFNELVAKETQTQQPSAAPSPVATRVIAPKPQVTASDKAAAAAPSRTAAAPARTVKNPLAMSDDEFMKQFENRL